MILTDVLRVLISWAEWGQGQGHAYWDLLSACLHHTSDCCYNGANTITTGRDKNDKIPRGPQLPAAQ